MTKQYLLRTTIKTNVRMFNLMETNSFDKSSNGYSNGDFYSKTKNKSGVSIHNHSFMKGSSANDNIPVVADETEGNSIYINKSINDILGHEYQHENVIVRTNVLLSDKESRNNINNNNGSNLSEVQGLLDGLLKEATPYDRQRYNTSVTKNNNRILSGKNDCQRFLYDNLNNAFNNSVFKKLEKKCSESKTKKIKFRVDKLFLGNIIENTTCLSKKMKYSTKKLPLIALASFPGSGNTWTRILIENITGKCIIYKCCYFIYIQNVC